jgi:predicted transposase YbfD/YdcC
LFSESAMAASGLSVFVERVARWVDGDAVAQDPDGGVGLLERFLAVGDGRSDTGRDHPVAVVLTLAAVAVVAGIRSFASIAGHVADVPADLVMALYERCGSGTTRPPSGSTIWRVLTGADAEAVDAVVGAWFTGRRAGDSKVVFVDGKTVRGACDAEGHQVHLLAALDGDGLVLAQDDVSVKTNEITCFAPLLDRIPLAGATVVADALHTQRGHAVYLHGRDADFVFCVKGNQPKLFDALDALPWESTPIGHESVDRGHGRITHRTIRALPAPDDLPFPHVQQVFLIERYVSDLRGRRLSAVAVCGVTSLPADRAAAEDLAGLVRGEWSIEVLHYKRDTLYQEDASRIRTRSGPRVMATLRNLAIGALHLAGRDDTTEATRWAARRPGRPFTILGLTS